MKKLDLLKCSECVRLREICGKCSRIDKVRVENLKKWEEFKRRLG